MINVIFVIEIGVFLITFVTFYLNYSKHKKLTSKKDLTGYDSALEVERKYDIDSYIIEKRGNFTDNYNYNKKVIKLSSLVFHDSNVYSVAMGYFIAYQAVLDKENNSLFKLKKLFEPLYYILIALSYISLILLAIANLNMSYVVILLSTCLIYELVFLKVNLDIIKKAKEKIKDNNIINALDSFYLIDLAFGVLYIRVLVDKAIDLIKRR